MQQIFDTFNRIHKWHSANWLSSDGAGLREWVTELSQQGSVSDNLIQQVSCNMYAEVDVKQQIEPEHDMQCMQSILQWEYQVTIAKYSHTFQH